MRLHPLSENQFFSQQALPQSKQVHRQFVHDTGALHCRRTRWRMLDRQVGNQRKGDSKERGVCVCVLVFSEFGIDGL